MKKPTTQNMKDEAELDRLYLRSADGKLSPKQAVRFAQLRALLVEPALASAYERQQQAVAAQHEPFDVVCHDPRDD